MYCALHTYLEKVCKTTLFNSTRKKFSLYTVCVSPSPILYISADVTSFHSMLPIPPPFHSLWTDPYQIIPGMHPSWPPCFCRFSFLQQHWELNSKNIILELYSSEQFSVLFKITIVRQWSLIQLLSCARC